MARDGPVNRVVINEAYSGVTFLNDRNNYARRGADVVMLGVACDLTASQNKGAWYGPQAIIRASHQVEYEVPIFGIPLTDKVRIHNAGILECPPCIDQEGNPITYTMAQVRRWMTEMVEHTKQFAKEAMDDNKTFMLFGGDHSVPNGVWHAMYETYNPADVTVLHFDAHLDLRDTWTGYKYSHACIMRRARDRGFRVVQVGPRDHISGEETTYIRQGGFLNDIFFCPTQPGEMYEEHAATIREKGIINPQNLIWDGALSRRQLESLEEKIVKSEHVWISIDVDGLDARDVPGTGTPLPLGLSTRGLREAVYTAIKVIREEGKHLVGFDINEVAPQLRKQVPIYDPIHTVNPSTETSAALLAYNMLFWNYLNRFKD